MRLSIRLQVMLGRVMRNGEVGVCATCMDARGIAEFELVEGTTEVR